MSVLASADFLDPVKRVFEVHLDAQVLVLDQVLHANLYHKSSLYLVSNIWWSLID